MLRKIRIALAAFFSLSITLLFLDFSGIIKTYLGWVAKLQFIPAVMAVNIIAIVVIIALTALFGRIYCSVVCPLGVLQDVISNISARKNKRRFSFSPAKKILRYSVLVAYLICIVLGISVGLTLLDPYAVFGRIIGSFLQPLYLLGNNLLATLAEHINSYAFYSVEIILKGALVMSVAAISLLVIAILAWKNGRTYCNTICPVGTLLGLFSKHSFFHIQIDENKCVNCGLCTKSCKSSAIDYKNHSIDLSRCVDCMDCIDVCGKKAISFSKAKRVGDSSPADPSKRAFALSSLAAATTAALNAQDKIFDGGLAEIAPKQPPVRLSHIVPPGSHSQKNFQRHCTACQLCVSECPNHVLRPSTDLSRFMQPEMSFEEGFCRPECTRCSQICPAGAITKITKEDATDVAIGLAVFNKQNCVVQTDGVSCGNCARNCPTQAIMMIANNPTDPESPKFPVVDEARCIGCGACEYVCPARPISAIHVEGLQIHH